MTMALTFEKFIIRDAQRKWHHQSQIKFLNSQLATKYPTQNEPKADF